MVDEKLREEMTKAYTNGDHKKALRLSRRLDRQILKEVKDKGENKKTIKKNLDMAKERTGYNVIPRAYAKVMSSISGFQINEEVYQINSPHHTGACAMQRLLNRSVFDGIVQKEYNYIILDVRP